MFVELKSKEARERLFSKIHILEISFYVDFKDAPYQWLMGQQQHRDDYVSPVGMEKRKRGKEEISSSEGRGKERNIHERKKKKRKRRLEC